MNIMLKNPFKGGWSQWGSNPRQTPALHMTEHIRVSFYQLKYGTTCEANEVLHSRTTDTHNVPNTTCL